MSITLLTGVPGSGKTLHAVWYANQQLKAGRRLMVDGIKNLAIDHEMVDEAWLRKWFDNAQQQDLIIVDEAQRIWPPVSVGSKIPEDIEKLHVHRHLGVDFILITQHPQRLNKTIRDLVGRHVHVRRLFGMRRAVLYEWDHCHNLNSLRDAVKTSWAYPRKVFDLYTSAEVHTKQKAVIPKALFVLPLAFILAVVMAVRSFEALSAHKKKPEAGHGAAVAVPAVAGSDSVADGGPVSEQWRVAGRYAMGSHGYVVLSNPSGQLRVEPSSGFKGEGSLVSGMVDGKRVAEWSGGGSSPVATSSAPSLGASK